MANITIGIDLGATKIQAAAMRDQAIIGTFRLGTPQSGQRDVSAAIVAASDAALAEAEAHRSEVRGVGIGAPLAPGRTSTWPTTRLGSSTPLVLRIFSSSTL